MRGRGKKGPTEIWRLDLGANLQNDGSVRFKVWAPFCYSVEVKRVGRYPEVRIPLEKKAEGFFEGTSGKISRGDRYVYVLDGNKERPDPVSRLLPRGLHEATEIVDPEAFTWSDRKWKGLPLREFVIYEMHVGTFTPDGTFDSAIKKISYLKKLGVTCLEIMPVAQFPGKRNWGYDGANLFSVQNSYGGPAGLKRLVNACHRAGLAVCLDVVYNHLGPEGNYLHDFGPYFTKKYHTPWGDALNYDDAGSGSVRDYMISNALYWIAEYHLDALRLDAVHGIYDFSAKHILEEIQEKVQRQAAVLGRKVALIAESDLNDTRIIRPGEKGGYDIDAQWSDDFHHAAHVVLTGERAGYYSDFSSAKDLAKAIRDAFVYDGKYSPFRKRVHGNSTEGLPFEKFVVCVQNHDQVGNRAYGERLNVLVPFSKQKLAAALLLLSPYVPLIFMGQEYGETHPFQYFVDHSDPALIEAVRKGRSAEFASFGWKSIPDPKSKKTFENSKLDWGLLSGSSHKRLLRLYVDLIRLREKSGLCREFPCAGVDVLSDDRGRWIRVNYKNPKLNERGMRVFFSFSDRSENIPVKDLGNMGRRVMDTEAIRYGGDGRKPVLSGGEMVIPPFSCTAWV